MINFLINLLLFIVILGVIVFVHEFGHFIWAKICGVYVYEFAIGMGPKIWGKKGKETEYTLRAIPIGGFCQLAGEDVETDKDFKIPKNRSLQDKNPFQRFLIMFFGAGNNFILAIILLFVIALIWGGSTMNPVITGVEKGSAAYKAGIKENDTVVKINNHKISTSDDIALYLAIANPEKKSTFVVERNGKKYSYKIKPEKIEKGKKETYKYGISMKQEKETGILGSLHYTFAKTKSIFKQMWVTVSALVTGGVKLSQLSGPVGIYSIVGEQRSAGFASILYLIAFLSINVGFINLLPLPAFDGGHILFILIEILRFGKPVNPKIENYIHMVGMILLLLLMVVVTINDVLRLIG